VVVPEPDEQVSLPFWDAQDIVQEQERRR
jgi:hypothetical protein